MMHKNGEIFEALKCRGRAPVFELVGQTGIALTHWCRLFDPLFSLNSIGVSSFWKTLIGSTSALIRDDYGEVFAALKGRMSSSPSYELVCLNRFQVGQYPGFAFKPFLETSTI
jgi:hypothetical protein